jgi:hypothetical protein
MRITKLRVKAGQVLVEFEEQNKNADSFDCHSLRSNELPRPELGKAMAGMAAAVVYFLETPKDWAKGLTVSGLSIIYSTKDPEKSVILSCQKVLEEGLAPLCFNTPKRSAEVFDEALKEVEAEAKKYIKGDRAQGTLPLEGEDADKEKEVLLEKATKIILETKRATVAAIQRRLRLGYTAAAGIMDALEARGIVGPTRGAEPREILVTTLPQEAKGNGKKSAA